MPNEVIKTTGPLKSSKPDVGGGATKNVPVFGIVKDNIDPTRSGRIKVLIGDKSPQDSDDSASWVTVSFLSNFFGSISGQGGGDNNGSYKANPSSYGEWHAPPDIGTKVICIFVNGDPNYGFYIGCVPEPETLQMVPAIGSSDKVQLNDGEAKSYGGATRLPVTNFNTNNKSLADSGSFNDSPRPVHSYSAAIMNQQGIIRDPIRGPISSSASREAASRVGWGVSTPGRPIYDGGYDDASIAKNLDSSKAQQLKVVARRGGHSFVMDDGDIIGRDQLIRIRTALGHQILMSDDGQTLMILHSNGQSYIELGKEGTVDIFSTNSINMRTQGDFNIHADRNVNIHAMENLNIQAKIISTNSEEKTKIRAGSDINLASVGKMTGLAGGAIAWGASGDASLVGGGQAYVNGSKVNLNSGSPGTSPEAVAPIPLVAQTDTLYDEQKGFIAAPGKLLTIASRAPAHAPWANAGQGVDIKTSMNASDNLPAPATSATKETNKAAQATNPAPPATATVTSAPANTPAASPAINKDVAKAAVAQTATEAAAGPMAAATKTGAAVVDTAQGKVAAVGAMAQTPAQMELGGTLKPGAATLVTGLVQAGKTVEQAMPKNLFTGLVQGAKDVTSFIKNTTAQATNLVNTFQKAQTALGAIGAITGKEAPTQITGMVTAAATVGLGGVTDTLKQVSTIAKGAETLANKVTGVVDSIAGGTNTVASNINVGESLLAGAADDKALVSATAVSSGITNSLNSLSGSLSGVASGVSGALNTATGALNNVAGAAGAISGAAGAAIGSASGALNSAAGALNSAAGAVNKAEGVLKAIGSGGAAAKLTEAVGGLGGIQSALTAMGSIPSLSSLVDQAEGIASSAFNAIKKSFKDFEANIPQNLTQIAKDNAAAAATTASLTGAQSLTSLVKNVGDAVSGVTGAVNSVTGAVEGAVAGVTSAVSSVSGSLSGISDAVGDINNSVSGITGAITTAGQTLNTFAGSASSVTATFNDVTAVVDTIATNTTNAINTTIGGVENAINSVSAFAGAGPTITDGGLPALSNAGAAVQSGAQAAVSSMLASGLTNLPGGINTVSSINNRATGPTINVPGTAVLTNAIKDATTSAMNGVNAITSATNALEGAAKSLTSVTNSVNNVTGAVSGALNTATSAVNNVTGAIGDVTGAANDAITKANDLLGDAKSALGSVEGKLNSLTKLASIGLPVGAIAELQSAIGALAGAVPGSIGLPSIGFNTSDRGSITKQIGNVLGDPGIPAPNLVGEITQQTKDEIDDAIVEIKKMKDELKKKLNEAKEKKQAAKVAFQKARDDLPAGDPGIETARAAYEEAIVEYNKISLEYSSADIQLQGLKYAKIDPAGYAAVKAESDATINNIMKATSG